VYCAGSKAVLKLIESENTLHEIAQPLLDEKLTVLSINTIADATNQTVETVTGILAGIRDEIVDHVIIKKNNASLNFGVGVLSLRQSGTVEFKSYPIHSSEFGEDRIPNSAEFDLSS
jgi:hypothetical protein